MAPNGLSSGAFTSLQIVGNFSSQAPLARAQARAQGEVDTACIENTFCVVDLPAGTGQARAPEEADTI